MTFFNEISQKISAISQVATTTADNAVKTSASGHELSLMASQLEGLITEFLLNASKHNTA